jgi:hypothetical protein
MNKYVKIAGWLLLLIGIGLMAWTLNVSYDIFYRRKNVPELFSATATSQSSSGSQASEIETQIESIISSQLQGIMPTDSITKILNLICWSILAFILIYGGAQISSIGIKVDQQTVNGITAAEKPFLFRKK